MTAGSNGVPEDDDPFAYLYRPAGGEGDVEAAPATAAAAQPGVPRTSYTKPTQVGRAQYGQPRPAQPAGYGTTVPPQQAPYAQPTAVQPAPGTGGGRRAAAGRGGSSRGLVIGAIAVVLAIGIGVGVALMGNKKDDKQGQTAAPGQSVSASSAPTNSTSAQASASASATANSSPVVDVSALQVQGGSMANSVQGGKSGDGKYVTLQQGTTITWNLQVPSAGPYKVWVHYDNPGSDATASVAVNGKEHGTGINLRNFAKKSDPTQAWVSSNVWPTLKAGANTIVLTCNNASCAGLLVDQFAVTDMGTNEYPG